jgi:alpha-amylase
MKKHCIFRKLFIVTVFSVLILVSTFADSNPYKITQQDLIYFALTDRFYDGDPSNDQNVHKKDLSAYHGGDFQGIIDKLDYIKSLGFTAIWISPVVANQVRGYHGYWPTDFYKTNEHFGSMDKLKELVATAHTKGIKIIVDLVVNHVGPMHPWCNDPQYANWFHHHGAIMNWDDQKEVEEGTTSNLPDLDQSNPEVKKYLIDMAKWWIEQVGFDGYRLDTVRHVSKDFWKEFVAEIKKEYPDFYFIGEVLDGRTTFVADYQKAGLDGLFDYPLYYMLNDVFKDDQPASRLIKMIQESHKCYTNPYLMGTILDTLDVPRFLDQINDMPEQRLKQGLAFMMTYTGIPVMYYGTEIGLSGGADPENRRDMNWSIKSPLTDYVRKLSVIRKTNKALTYGNFQVIKFGDDFLCYMRRFEDNSIITVFNLSDEEKRVELSLPAESRNEKGSLKELTESKSFKINKGVIKLVMGPRQVNIFSNRENN